MRIVFTALLLFCTLACQAQKFSLGPSAKAGISQVLFNKTDTVVGHSISNKLSFSLQAGAFAEYKFAKRFGAGLELLYWWQNGKVEDEFTYTDIISGKPVSEVDVYRAHLSYFAIPVFFHYYMQDVVLMLGAQSGFEFGEAATIQVTTSTDGVTEKFDETDFDSNLEDFDVGIKAGVLYKISDQVTAGLEYYNGRVNLSQNNDLPYASRNQYFYGSLRYNLIRGKRGEIYYN